jgi:hypothetical protein
VAKLSGSDVEDLSKLLASTLSESDLEVIVYSSTGDQLYEAYVGPGRPLRKTIHELLVELENLGLTHLVLAAVYERRPKRSDVRAKIARLCPEAVATAAEGRAELSVQHGGEAESDAPADALAPGLQRNVRPHLAKLDVRVWLERLTRIERQVCRVEHGGNSVGTGFLVGPAAVLTNWHVVEDAQRQGALSNLACRFDYLALPGGARQPGTVIPLGPEGCLDASPYAPAELTRTPDVPPPTANELDYALLRLDQPIGELTANGAPRGWIELPSTPPSLEPGAPLLIVQHPDGAPMKLALDTAAVIGRWAANMRIRYRTNTDPGSSGSPCFTMDWDLAALHHYGDPAWREPLFNQGVPAELIRQKIFDRGHGAALAG